MVEFTDLVFNGNLMETEITYYNKRIVIQPTTICNLNCRYCYLPNRKSKSFLIDKVCEVVADYTNSKEFNFEIIWHGGEPLSCGIDNFRRYLNYFSNSNCKHSVQTNATLIDENWCTLFLEHDMNIGVSIDGGGLLNFNRVGWTGKPSVDKAMKGIELLNKCKIKFSAISVITKLHLQYAEELYKFFTDLGCWSWGLNMEEYEGLNKGDNNFNTKDVEDFWLTLFNCWRSNPRIRIREFDYVLTWMDRVLQQPNFTNVQRQVEAFPTISCSGDLVLLSPEFLDANVLGHDFIIGNVLEDDISELLKNFEEYQYVQEFTKGITKCSKECAYFSFCGGGYASNKFFENGTLNSSFTKHCNNAKITLVDTITKTICYE